MADGPAITGGEAEAVVPAGVKGSRDLIPRELRVGQIGKYLRGGAAHLRRRSRIRRKIMEGDSNVSTVEDLNACFARTVPTKADDD